MVDNVPSDEEILKKVNDAFAGLDQQRAGGLENLKILQTIKDDAAQREKIRLTQKYGADHPKVKKISNRIAYNQGLQKELDIEIERTGITIPDIDVNTWMVHGRVLNPEGKPLSGQTVSFYDEEGNWIEKLGYACTDERGYFAIKYTVELNGKPDIPDTQKLILAITTNEGSVIHQETAPLYLKTGQIDYRLIVVDDKGIICPSPITGDGGSAVIPPDLWVVRGVVLYEDMSPGTGLIISLYDKDLFFDDALGTVLTDESGRFQIVYRTEAFQSLFDKKPDLYLKVLDNQGTQLYSSEKTFRSEAGRVENFHIVLNRAELRSKK